MTNMPFEFHWFGDEVLDVTMNELTARLTASVYHLQGEMIQKVSSVGRGETYRVPGTSNTTYTASAPYDAPAVLFGQLKNSIAVEIRHSASRLEVVIGVRAVPYAKRLEFGFVGVDSRGRRYNQAPRPFFKKTYEEQRQHLIHLIRNGV